VRNDKPRQRYKSSFDFAQGKPVRAVERREYPRHRSGLRNDYRGRGLYLRSRVGGKNNQFYSFFFSSFLASSAINLGLSSASMLSTMLERLASGDSLSAAAVGSASELDAISLISFQLARASALALAISAGWLADSATGAVARSLGSGPDETGIGEVCGSGPPKGWGPPKAATACLDSSKAVAGGANGDAGGLATSAGRWIW